MIKVMVGLGPYSSTREMEAISEQGGCVKFSLTEASNEELCSPRKNTAGSYSKSGGGHHNTSALLTQAGCKTKGRLGTWEEQMPRLFESDWSL